MPSAITSGVQPEREQEQYIRFEILVKGYGQRGKLVRDLSLRLCKMLHSMFDNRFELRVEQDYGSGKYPSRYSQVIFNREASEGGTVTIRRPASTRVDL